MKRLLGVALVVMAVLWVRRTDTAGTDPPTTALALGFTLIAAMVTGELLRRFQLPRLTGYLLFGILVGPYLGNVITQPMARELQTVNGIATALIAFIAGLTLNFERLGFRVAGTGRFIGTTIAVAMLGLFAVAWIVVGVAARGAGRRGHRQARDGHAVRHRRHQLLADDDGRRDFGYGRTGAPERSRSRDCRPRGPRRARAVLGGDAVRTSGPWRGCRRRRERARPARVGNPRRAGVWRSGRRLVRAVSALRGTRGHPGPPRCVRAAQSGRQDAGVRTAAGRHGRRAGDPERRGPAGRRAEGGDPARSASGARGVLRRDRDVAAARCARSDRVRGAGARRRADRPDPPRGERPG